MSQTFSAFVFATLGVKIKSFEVSKGKGRRVQKITSVLPNNNYQKLQLILETKFQNMISQKIENNSQT
jgi:hypothetical protein